MSKITRNYWLTDDFGDPTDKICLTRIWLKNLHGAINDDEESVDGIWTRCDECGENHRMSYQDIVERQGLFCVIDKTHPKISAKYSLSYFRVRL